MFKKVLIANRGEIAMRIIRACKELGIRSVVAHSEPDVDSLPVRFADQAVCIGPREAVKSYLNIPAIISAAEVTDCDAIHPGYGFLAENAGFADICESCKITFIGPSVDNIRLMGDKVQAREIAAQAGIPVVPGSDGAITDDMDAVNTARRIGFPVILKAAAGGGGKGMRVVHDEDELLDSLNVVRAEAVAAFGSGVVYIEKFITEPRHIEVQVLGDKHGNVVHMFERDCSIQRRHQKIIEESPSTGLDEETRRKMGEMAIKLVKHIGYYTAGTIEFLLDGGKNFYFMEMNTRLQVEHPVTEMVIGLDIVKEQIKTAAGRELGIKQEDVKLDGHSIECRVNAEDPENFLPSSGKVEEIYFPGGPGVRVDTALFAGYVVTPFYDSLIAKVIVKSRNRQEAIARMRRALGEFHITGIKTTIPVLYRILHSEQFVAGNLTTRFLEEFME